jgi:hypothetical protein
MPLVHRHRSSAAIYRERLRNLARARAARRRIAGTGRRRKVGGVRRSVHRRVRRRVYRVPASSMTFGGARRRHYRKRRGGFLPAFSLIPASVATTHTALQQIKPFTNAEKLADTLGFSDAISKGLDRLGIFGSALRGIHNFAKGTLGYGRARRHRRKVGGVRRRRVHRRY